MRKLLQASILFFTFCFCALGQTSDISTCPTVSVTGPDGITKPNDLIDYSVTVDTKGKDLTLQYIWSVSDGKIVEGQGAQNIKIKRPTDGCLTVTVEVRGLPVGCSNLASERSCIDLPPQAVKIDESSQPFAQISKNRINEIVSA